MKSLKCYLDPESSDGANRILGGKGLADGLPGPPQVLEYAFRKDIDVPDEAKDSWSRSVDAGAWSRAEALWHPETGTLGWRVPAGDFEANQWYLLALRDPQDPGSPLSTLVFAPLRWLPRDPTEAWPGAVPGPAPEPDLTSGWSPKAIIAVVAGLAALLLLVWQVPRWLNPPLTARDIEARTHPGGTVEFDFDRSHADYIRGTDGKAFEVLVTQKVKPVIAQVDRDHVIVYRAPADKQGEDTFRYRVVVPADGESDEAAIRVEVVNRLPQARDYQYPGKLVAGNATTLDLTKSVSDPDADHGARLKLLPLGKSPFGTFEDPQGLQVRFTGKGPGLVHVPYQVEDPLGGMGAANIRVQVDANGSPPPPPATTLAEIGPLQVPVGDEFEVDLRVRLPGEGAGLRLVEVGRPEFGTVRRLDDHRFVYKAPLDREGRLSFSYRVTNTAGQPQEGQVAFQVVNQPPRPRRIEVATPAGTPVEVAFDGDAVDDPDAARGQTYRLDSVGPPRFGTFRGDGLRRTFDPGMGSGSFEVPYRVEDQAGALAEGRLRVSVSAPPPPPAGPGDIRIPDPIAVGATMTYYLRDLLPAGDQHWRLESVGEAALGRVERLDEHQFRYTAPRRSAGEDQFTYQAIDADGQSAGASVRLRVVNRAPVARDLVVSTYADQPIEVDLAAEVADPDRAAGQTLSIEHLGRPAFGAITPGRGLALRFDPQGGTGTLEVPYSVQDEAGGEAHGRIRIEVGPRPVTVSIPPPPSAEQGILNQVAALAKNKDWQGAKDLCERQGKQYRKVALTCGTAFDPLRTHRAPNSDKAFALRCYELAERQGDREAARRAQALREDPD